MHTIIIIAFVGTLYSDLLKRNYNVVLTSLNWGRAPADEFTTGLNVIVTPLHSMLSIISRILQTLIQDLDIAMNDSKILSLKKKMLFRNIAWKKKKKKIFMFSNSNDLLSAAVGRMGNVALI